MPCAVTSTSTPHFWQYLALMLVHGRDKVARLLVAVVKDLLADLTIGYAEVNGGPAALLVAGGELWESWSWTPASKATG